MTLAIALAGLALGTAAFIWLGAGHVVHAILVIGWRGIVSVVAWQLAVFVLLGIALADFAARRAALARLVGAAGARRR